MQQDIISNLVMVDFYMCADHLNFSEINLLLNIPNSKERKRESFMDEEFAKDYWSIDTGYKKVDDVNEQIDIILNLLQPKIELIKETMDKFNAECGFLIVIKGNSDSPPAIYFEQNLIKVAAQLGANINIDFS